MQILQDNKIDVGQCIPDLWVLMSEEDKNLVVNNFRISSFKKNEVIYYEGETPAELLCLLSGKVKISRDGVGRNQIIRIIKPCEYFGYRAYFAGEEYVTTASAFETCDILSIPMKIVEHITFQNARLAMFFIHLLAADLGTSDKRIVSLTQKHLRGRLAETIVSLLDSYGTDGDGATISVYLSREEIANLSNMTTANAIRTLSAFVSEKILAVNGRKIKVIDEKRLRKINHIGW